MGETSEWQKITLSLQGRINLTWRQESTHGRFMNAMRRGARLFPISIVETSSEFLRDNMGKRTDVIMELSQTTQIPVVSRKKYRYRNGNMANSL